MSPDEVHRRARRVARGLRVGLAAATIAMVRGVIEVEARGDPGGVVFAYVPPSFHLALAFGFGRGEGLLCPLASALVSPGRCALLGRGALCSFQPARRFPPPCVQVAGKVAV